MNNNNTCYQRNKERLLEKAWRWLGKCKRIWKESLQEHALNKYSDLSNRQIDIKRDYGRNWSRNMSEYAKKKIVYKQVFHYNLHI